MKEATETKETESLKERIKELEAKIAEKEEKALERVCKALNIEPETITEKTNKEPETIINCFVPTPVRVNQTIYQGSCEMPLSTFHVVQQALGDRRQRLLKELTGNNYLLTELQGVGGFVPKVVGKVDANGERIA